MRQAPDNGGDIQHSRLVTLLAILIGICGIGLRIRQFAANRSLWFDEASLALNIVNRPFLGLVHPLGHNQAAPIGFLLAQKVLISLLGNRDSVLRLFPLIASIASVPLMYRLLSAHTSLPDRRIRLLALWLFAVSQPLIWYGSEAKQYSTDVLATLTLLVLAQACLHAHATPKHLFNLAIAGALSLWVSHPSLFVVVGITIALTSDQLTRKDWRGLRVLGAMLLPQAASFALLYLIALRPLAGNPVLLKYWRAGFMPMPPWRDVAWFPRFFFAMLTNPLRLPFPSMSAILVLGGCISLALRRWQLTLCLILPLLAALAASGCQKYPLSDRLLLFAVPAVYLLVAEGLTGAHRLLSYLFSRHKWVPQSIVCLLALMLVYHPSVVAFFAVLHPDKGEDIKPVMSYVSQRRAPGELLYIYYGAIPAFTYYASFYGIGEGAFVRGRASRKEPIGYLRDMERLRGHKRVWFLFSHGCTWCMVNEEAFYLRHLDQAGRRIDEFHAVGASAYLYSFNDPG